MKINNKISYLVVITLIVSIITSIPVVSSQNDANSGNDAPDDPSNAFAIDLDTIYSGTIGELHDNVDGNSDNEDNYKYTISEQGNISIYFEVTNPGTTSFSTVSILSEDETIIATDTLFNDDTPIYFDTHVISAQTVYFQVQSYSDNVTYTFEGSFTASSYQQYDAGSQGDASLLSPKSISLDTEYSGLIGNGEVNEFTGTLDTTDWYQISLPDEGYLDCSTTLSTPESPDLSLSIYIDTTKKIVSETSLTSSSLAITAPIYGADTFQISLSSYSWNASYSFSCSFTETTIPMQNDAGSGADASENYDDANTVTLNSSFIGTIGEGLLEAYDHARDEYDYYKLNISSTGMLNVTLKYIESTESFGGGATVRLYNASDIISLSYFYVSVSSISPSVSKNIILDPDENYYLVVSSSYENTTYEIDMSFYLDYDDVDRSSIKSTSSESSSQSVTDTSSSKTTDNKQSTNEEDPTSSELSLSSIAVISVIAFAIPLLLRYLRRK